MKITYTLQIDEGKLDEWVRQLYDGPPDDPVLGEPTPGLHQAEGWLAEARENLAEGWGPDTAWWTHMSTKDNDGFIDYIEVEISD